MGDIVVDYLNPGNSYYLRPVSVPDGYNLKDDQELKFDTSSYDESDYLDQWKENISIDAAEFTRKTPVEPVVLEYATDLDAKVSIMAAEQNALTKDSEDSYTAVVGKKLDVEIKADYPLVSAAGVKNPGYLYNANVTDTVPDSIIVSDSLKVSSNCNGNYAPAEWARDANGNRALSLGDVSKDVGVLVVKPGEAECIKYQVVPSQETPFNVKSAFRSDFAEEDSNTIKVNVVKGPDDASSADGSNNGGSSADGSNGSKVGLSGNDFSNQIIGDDGKSSNAKNGNNSIFSINNGMIKMGSISAPLPVVVGSLFFIMLLLVLGFLFMRRRIKFSEQRHAITKNE
jgi:hypothetical protein